MTGLPIVHVEREIDPAVRRSSDLGFLNGHVPITAVITAAALVAAVLDRRDAVVLSNEWSASVPTLVHDGHPVNHQWSKGAEFEEGFARLVASTLGRGSRSSPTCAAGASCGWHRSSPSSPSSTGCSAAAIERSTRTRRSGSAEWCGTCDKCCFIDLILSPFMERRPISAPSSVAMSPWTTRELEGRFSTLLGTGARCQALRVRR